MLFIRILFLMMFAYTVHANSEKVRYINMHDSWVDGQASEAGFDRFFSNESLGIYKKALPRLQLFNLIRDRIPDILKAYQNGSPNIEPEFESLNLTVIKFLTFQKRQYREDSSIDHSKDWGVYFNLSPLGQFKIKDIVETRLAVNTGQEILFHAAGIAQLPEFTFNDALSLYLHELFHFNSKVSIALRDKIALDIVEWVSARTVRIPLKNGSIFYAVKLNLIFPNEVSSDEIGNCVLHYRMCYNSTLLSFTHSKEGITIDPDLNSIFSVFGNQDPGDPPAELPIGISGNSYDVPITQIDNVSLNQEEKIVFLFSVHHRTYTRIEDGHFRNYKAKLRDHNQPEELYKAQFQVEYDLKEKNFTSEKILSNAAQSSYFELNYPTYGDFYFIKLLFWLRNVDVEKYRNLKNPIFLQAAVEKTGSLSLFPDSGLRRIEGNDVLVSFSLPTKINSEIQIKKVIIPILNKAGNYQEDVLSAKMKLSQIVSNGERRKNWNQHFKVKTFKIEEAYSMYRAPDSAAKAPPTHFKIEVSSAKKLNYVQIEINHGYEPAKGQTDIVRSIMTIKNKYLYRVEKDPGDNTLTLIAPSTNFPMPLASQLWKPWNKAYIQLVKFIMDDGTVETMPNNLLGFGQYQSKIESSRNTLPDSIDFLMND